MDDGRRSGGESPDAHERAVRLLARRPLSEAELCRALGRAGHAEQDIEAAVGRLRQAGYLDDRRLAEQVVRFHEGRGHGPRRALEELSRRGVAAELIRAALDGARSEPGGDPRAKLHDRLRELLQAEGRPVDDRALRRVYNRLLRAGFEQDEVNAALEPFFLSERDAEPDPLEDEAPRERRSSGNDDDHT